MTPTKLEPIEVYSWGKFVVRGKEHSESDAGQVGMGKDIRIVGDVVTEWKERKGHQLSIKMITGVFKQGIEVLVVGTGWYGGIACPEEVLEEIETRGIDKVILLKTPEACQEYNRLILAGKKAALLAHGTC